MEEQYFHLSEIALVTEGDSLTFQKAGTNRHPPKQITPDARKALLSKERDSTPALGLQKHSIIFFLNFVLSSSINSSKGIAQACSCINWPSKWEDWNLDH